MCTVETIISIFNVSSHEFFIDRKLELVVLFLEYSGNIPLKNEKNDIFISCENLNIESISTVI